MPFLCWLNVVGNVCLIIQILSLLYVVKECRQNLMVEFSRNSNAVDSMKRNQEKIDRKSTGSNLNIFLA